MHLEFYPEVKLKKEILKIASENLDLEKWRIFFFGSRVKGDNFPRADIDVGVDGPEELPAGVKLKMEDEFDLLPTLYTFDVVDFKKVSEKFRKEALKNIEYVK